MNVRRIGGRERPVAAELVDIGVAEADEAEPANQMRVAKRPAGAFDIGAQQVNCFAILLALLFSSRDYTLNQGSLTPLTEFLQTLVVGLIQIKVAAQKTGLGQRGEDDRVLHRRQTGIAGRSDTEAKHQAGIVDPLSQPLGVGRQ